MVTELPPAWNDVAFAVEVVRVFEELCDHNGEPFQAANILGPDRDFKLCGCAACRHGGKVAFAVCQVLQVDLRQHVGRARIVIPGVNDGGGDAG